MHNTVFSPVTCARGKNKPFLQSSRRFVHVPCNIAPCTTQSSAQLRALRETTSQLCNRRACLSMYLATSCHAQDSLQSSCVRSGKNKTVLQSSSLLTHVPCHIVPYTTQSSDQLRGLMQKTPLLQSSHLFIHAPCHIVMSNTLFSPVMCAQGRHKPVLQHDSV